jgi:hypothetical protein
MSGLISGGGFGINPNTQVKATSISGVVTGLTTLSEGNCCPRIYGAKRPPIRYVYDKASKRMVQVTC